jgi:hypothetical protein
MKLNERLNRYLRIIKEDRTIIDMICSELKENITKFFKGKIDITNWREYEDGGNPCNLVINIESSIESPTLIDLYIYDKHVEGRLSIETPESLSELHDIVKRVYIKYNSPQDLKNKVVKEISNWVTNNWKRILPHTSKLIKMTNDNRLNSNDLLKIEQAKKGMNFIRINPNEIQKAIKYSPSITASRIILEPFISGIKLQDYANYLEKASTPINILAVLKEYIKDSIRFVKEEIQDYPLKYGALNKDNVYDYYNYLLDEQDSPGEGPAYDLIEFILPSMIPEFSNLTDKEVNSIRKIIEKSIFIDKLNKSWNQKALIKKLFKEVYK